LFLMSEFPVGSSSGGMTAVARTTISDGLFALKDIDHAWDRLISDRRKCLEASRAPERREAFFDNLYRLSGDRLVGISPNQSHIAATNAGFQHDEIEQLLEECVSDGVIARDVKSGDISFTDTGFARETQRASKTVSVTPAIKTAAEKKKELIEDLIERTRTFELCGPSDDPDEITGVTTGFRYLVTQFKRLAGPLLASQFAERLDGIDVDVNDIYSAYDAKGELDALLPEIEAAMEHFDGNTFTQNNAPALAGSRKVFVVHGHDNKAKRTVASFLKNLNLEPIILHEQPNKSRTIIEKFEQHTDVAFAVVLLTPDDFGGSVSTRRKTKLRARQNVVFEFGYFVGKLGRKRVCALMAGKIEKPSDIDGVLYIPFEADGEWQIELGRELQAAGIEVDLKKNNKKQKQTPPKQKRPRG
ncbi:MAG TPA: nucleotide-binding protein, partial [Nitrospira sp.]|nr:nucleotide-binding protein [Nitrospira sp.]